MLRLLLLAHTVQNFNLKESEGDVDAGILATCGGD
jgi:hypothetical protein